MFFPKAILVGVLSLAAFSHTYTYNPGYNALEARDFDFDETVGDLYARDAYAEPDAEAQAEINAICMLPPQVPSLPFLQCAPRLATD